MNSVMYNRTTSWNVVKNILKLNPEARLVAWPSTMCTQPFYVIACEIPKEN